MTAPDSNSIDASAIDYRALKKQLAQFSRLETPPVLSDTESANVRAALKLFNEAADYETLGVCADTLEEGKAAIEAYVATLRRPIQLDRDPRSGPVYLKFNTLKGAWYLDDYVGTARGVLISFHASEPEVDVINGTYGPFPLDLFG